MTVYPPELFSNHDLSQALHIAAQVKFATICFAETPDQDVVFAPFVLGGHPDAPVFFGHLARANPLNEILSRGDKNARLIFQAADAYVSPAVYSEKARSGKVVPTWNYVASQFAGALGCVPNEQLMDILCQQVDDFERAVDSNWKLDDAPADFLDHMANGIFGIKFVPRTWTVHKKLSQNRQEDRLIVLSWLEKRDTPKTSLSTWMKLDLGGDG